MRQPTFRQYLFKHVRPRLRALGFKYDPQMEDRAITYGFLRHISDDLFCTVEFQRHSYEETAHGYGFTLNVLRFRQDKAGQRHPFDEMALGGRIGELMMSLYGVRLELSMNTWWEGSRPEMVVANLQQAVDKFERYCLPVLLDVNFRHEFWPGGLPVEELTLQNIADKTISPRLAELGYLAVVDPGQAPPNQFVPARRRHYVKAINEGMQAFIGLERYKMIERFGPGNQAPPAHRLGVLIGRKPPPDPNMEIDSDDRVSFQGWLAPHTKSRADLPVVMSESVLWNYVPAALPLQLEIILKKLEQVGIPALEGS